MNGIASWGIPLLTAIGGAAFTLSLQQIYEWDRRPKLDIDFEERGGQKPYIPDYNDESMRSAGYVARIKYLLLRVHNKGRKPALDCEAKLEVVLNEAKNTPYNVVLHWSRRDPAIYSEVGDGGILLSPNNEKVFAPINLNVNDKETVDVLMLPYLFSTVPNTDHTPKFQLFIESADFHRRLKLQPKTKYICKVTVYSSTANPKTFKFNVDWDGTLDGFSKAFNKD